MPYHREWSEPTQHQSPIQRCDWEHQSLNDSDERLETGLQTPRRLWELGSMSQDLAIADFLLLLWAVGHCYHYFGRQHTEIRQAIEIVAFPGQMYLPGKWKQRRGLGHEVKREMALTQSQRPGPLYPLSWVLSSQLMGVTPNLTLWFFTNWSKSAVIRPLERLSHYNRHQESIFILLFIALRTTWALITWRDPFGW